MKTVELSIIIVTYNTKIITYECVCSIFNSNTKYSFEVILIDNNSVDGTSEFLKTQFPQINYISLNENTGFSKANNIGIKNANGTYILLLNSDTILFTDSIEKLLSSALKNSYLISSPILLNRDHSIQKSCFDFPKPIKTFLRLTDFYSLIFGLLKILGNIPIKNKVKDIRPQYVSFACVLINKEVLLQIGLLDENLIFYHEDCEFGLRARQFNIPINFCTNSKLIHLGGSSSNEFSLFAFENDIMGLLYLYKKYYNKFNFTLEKISILSALIIRIVLWNFGFYRRVKKISIYKDTIPVNLKNKYDILNKYKSVYNFTLNYKFK
jgi:GT2 family glycosyltransferase